jgi:amidase
MAADIHAYSSATEMLAALDKRQISARELLQLHEARIALHDRALNVIVVRDAEAAQRAAEAADERRARGERGALLGLPITLKESMNVKGLPTTVGVRMWADFRSQHDGAIAERTQQAGAVLLGKTNVAPMLFDWQADNEVYGRTNNPWDERRTPGGSSGGSAAVAAGLTAIDYGSDIGGSIRVPAAFCGIYGHRPSDGALPRSGQFPFPPLPNSAMMMAVQGPLARSVEDLELAFDAVAGPDVGDDVALTLSLPRARRERLADFRVAVLPPIPWVPLAHEVSAALERFVEQLAKHGCTVARTQPDGLGDQREAYALYLTLLTAVTSAASPKELRERRLELLRQRDDEDAAAQIRALEGWAGDYLTWNGARERIRASYRAFFRSWDVLICPNFYGLPFEHFSHPWPPNPAVRTMLTVDGNPVPYDLGLFYPSIATLPGQPATAFPVGLSASGLPIGLQAIGPYLEDRTTLRFAALVAREWGGFRPPPNYPR